MTPISAKNTSVTEMLAALKRRLRNTLTSSIGWRQRRSHATNAAKIAAPAPKASMIVALVQPRSGASMRPHTTTVEAGGREHGAEDVEPRGSRIAGLRHQQQAGDQTEGDDRQVHEEHAVPREVLDEEAARDRADGHAEARRRRPTRRSPSGARGPGRCS